jgi:hypothetical protein
VGWARKEQGRWGERDDSSQAWFEPQQAAAVPTAVSLQVAFDYQIPHIHAVQETVDPAAGVGRKEEGSGQASQTTTTCAAAATARAAWPQPASGPGQSLLG